MPMPTFTLPEPKMLLDIIPGVGFITYSGRKAGAESFKDYLTSAKKLFIEIAKPRKSTRIQNSRSLDNLVDTSSSPESELYEDPSVQSRNRRKDVYMTAYHVATVGLSIEAVILAVGRAFY